MRLKYLPCFAAAVAAAALVTLGSPGSARATMELRITSGANTSGVVVLTPDVTGTAMFSTTVGDYAVSVTVTTNAPGTPSLGSLTTTTVDLNKLANTTDTVKVEVLDNDYNMPSEGLILQAGYTANFQKNANAADFSTTTAYLDGTGGTNFSTGSAAPSHTFLGTVAGAQSDNEENQGPIAHSANYTLLSTSDTLLENKGDKVSLTIETDAVPTPAPTSALLALSALPLLGWVVWRRRQRVVAA